MISRLLDKKYLFWNFLFSLFLTVFDVARVQLASKISKTALETLGFAAITFFIYAFAFFGLTVFASIITSVISKISENKGSERIVVFLLNAIFVVILLIVTLISEPFIFVRESGEHTLQGKRIPYPNILLITIDTLRQDHLSSTGYKDITTPNIDYFSKEGVTFSNAHCQIPVTTPSHASIHTGLNPYLHKSRNNGSPISENTLTLAEILSGLGYKTAAFVSSTTLKSRLSGLSKGFDYYDQFLCPRYWDQRLYLLMIGRLALRLRLYNAVERSADRTNDSVLHWLKKNSRERFFLWVHYFDPHAPYVPHEGLSSVYLKGEKYKLTADYKLINSIYDGIFKPSDSELDYLISLYDGEIMFVDRKLGELIRFLRLQKIFQDTMIILTADHGESLGEHNYYFYHGSKLYEPSMKVPLFFSGKLIKNKGTIISSQVRSIDIAPSILSLIDKTDDEFFEGESIFPLFEMGRYPRLLYGENVNKFSFSSFVGNQDDIMRKKRSIMINEKKLIENPEEGTYEFYDLNEDPMEISNIYDSSSEVENFRRALELIKEKYEKEDEQSKEIIDEGTLEDLKTLGYVE